MGWFGLVSLSNGYLKSILGIKSIYIRSDTHTHVCVCVYFLIITDLLHIHKNIGKSAFIFFSL